MNSDLKSFQPASNFHAGKLCDYLFILGYKISIKNSILVQDILFNKLITLTGKLKLHYANVNFPNLNYHYHTSLERKY